MAQQAFPGHGQMKPEQIEIEKLRREARLDAGLHRIERLMRQEGLRARPRRRGLPKDAGQRHAVSPKILERAFVALAPNQKWIAEFTYV